MDHPGRKPIASRRVLEAVLWILNTGAQWHMLPSYLNKNSAPALSGLVSRRDSAPDIDGCC